MLLGPPWGLSYLWESGTCVPSRQGCAAGWLGSQKCLPGTGHSDSPQGQAERRGGKEGPHATGRGPGTARSHLISKSLSLLSP